MRMKFSAATSLLAGVLLLAGCAAKPTQGGQALLMGKFAGDLQSASPLGSVPQQPAVRVTDDAFNPMEGVSVTFTVKSGGGSVSGSNAVTDVNGIARVGGWTLGQAAGINTMSANVEGAVGSPATFTASAVVPPVGEGPKGDKVLRDK